MTNTVLTFVNCGCKQLTQYT